MKRIFVLFAVLLSLSLCSAVLASDSCVIDDFGCYLMNEDNQQTYIMFWSEAARKAIMGDMSAPYELVVAKPEGNITSLPLNVPVSASAAAAVSNGLSESNCLDTLLFYVMSTNGCEDENYNPVYDAEYCKTQSPYVNYNTPSTCMAFVNSITNVCFKCMFDAALDQMNQGRSVTGNDNHYLEKICVGLGKC